MSLTIVDGQTYSVRDLCQYPTAMFEDLPDANVFLAFDDGVIPSSVRELIHARFCWDLYQYTPRPAVLKHHHSSREKSGVNPMTVSEILNDIFWDSKALSDAEGLPIDVDNLCYQQYCIIDRIDSFVRRKLGEYVVSFTIRDFHDVIEAEPVKEAQELLDSKEYVIGSDITRVYKTISKVVERDERFSNHPLGMAARSKSIKMAQLHKCVGPNGFVTDVDSFIFQRPVRSSFARGLQHLVDVAIESRTSAMSLYYQTDAMSESEYLTRRLQSAVSVVTRVHRGVDCGSRNYLPFTVPIQGNLADLMGKWYYDPETETEKVIMTKGLDIRGSVIHIRSPLTCQLGDRSGCCERCYGLLAESLMDGDNVGQLAATDLQEKQTQRILSNKHLVGSANVDIFTFSEGDSKWLFTMEDISEIFLNRTLKGKRILLSFNQKEAARLQDIMFVERLEEISPTRLTRLEHVKMSLVEEDAIVAETVIKVSTTTRCAFFTTEALRYIKAKGWNVGAKGEYLIDLTDWDADLPLMDMPPVQFSTPAHMMAVRDFLTLGVDPKYDYRNRLAMAPTAAAALSAFYDLVQSSLRVNLAHLEIIVLAYMVESIENSDYRIPRDKSKGKIATYNDIMYNRDIALAISYEAHFKYLFQRLSTFTQEKRQPHPFAQLLVG